jgi:hypothetical protein
MATNIGRIIVSLPKGPAQMSNFSEASTFLSDRSMLTIAASSAAGPIAAPDVCDGTFAVGESQHRILRRIRWATD